MIPIWLYLLSILYLGIGFFGSGFVLYDIIKNKNRQKMKIMNIVWPITTWYLGAIGIFAYKRIGKLSYQDKSDDNENMQNNTNFQKKRYKKTFLQQIFNASTHCGAGCTLGDVISEWLIFIIALSILGSTLLASYTIDFIFAYGLGVIFQYFTIVPMIRKKKGEKISVKEGLKDAIKADSLSLISYEIGLFFWMGLTQLVFFHPRLEPNEPTFWFMMQIGMSIGLITTYPANWLLLKKGIKIAM